ncbi:MAG: glycosyltransferase family 4 protein [Bacteroidales bacterium]|nr:glycosyltransferase family 4 protein [Bacteroidales bacterium]
MQSVLVLTNSLDGLHSFRKEVVQAILDAGYEVYLSAPASEFASFFEGIGCRMLVTPIDRRGVNPLKDIQLLKTYRRLIKQVQPKMVLTYTIKPNVYGGLACRLTHTPQLANITGLGDSIETPGLLQKVSMTLYRIGLKKAKVVFFQNRYNQEFCILHRMVQTKNVLLPGSGVNLDWHTLQDYPDDEVIRFIFVGRLLVQKGVSELFSAIKTIKEKYGEKVEFHICGKCEDDYQRKLDEYVENNYVVYHGNVKDIRPYFTNTHCNIMPSYHEGMSNVCLEAAAAGRPSITTNVPGCMETVDDGLSGILIPARNAQALLEAVERFIQMTNIERKQMGLAGRAKVEREFSRELVVKKYMAELGGTK